MSKEKDLEILKHELRMEELKYDRNTQLLILQRQWELNNMPQMAMARQQQFYQQSPPPVDEGEDPMENRSKEKYGGKK